MKVSNLQDNNNFDHSYPSNIKHYQRIQTIGKGSSAKVSISILNFVQLIKVWAAIILEGNHKGEVVAIKEVDLEKLDDENLQNLQVKTIYIIR